MKFFIYVPGMPFDGDTINAGKSLGGSESAGYYTAKELARRGHSVFVFSNMSENQGKKIDDVVYIPIGSPTKEKPFGETFHMYVENVPHDICLAQRAPGVFSKKFNSKLNYFWTHDLALKCYLPQVNNMMWNVNKVFGVSEWHKNQIQSVYDIDEDYLSVLRNGIDLNLFKSESQEKKIKSKTLLYSSRPERGLINLVKDNGIMDKLYTIDPEIRLVVVGYDNTTQQMAEFYNYLWGQCEKLPNVINYGHLSKSSLADLMSKIWLHVYPTEFEETSCITAMEEQAAGTPFIHTDVGALMETLKGGGNYTTTIEKFPNTIEYFLNNPARWESLHKKANRKAGDYTYEKVIDDFEKVIESDFMDLTKDKKRLYYHFLYNSDIYAASKVAEMGNEWDFGKELKTFETFEKSTIETKPFYDRVAKYNINIGNDHDIDNPDALLTMPRMKPIVDRLRTLKTDSIVLDYGCCVGQITIALAKAFPSLKFEGYDISKKQIDIGQEYIRKNDLKNIELKVAGNAESIKSGIYDMIICCEVLEHIHDYRKFLEQLEKCAKLGAEMIMSTPFGPMEIHRGESDHPMEHLHHFEEADIKDLLQNKIDINIQYVSDRDRSNGDKLGNYVWSWTVDQEQKFGNIDYDRKLKIQNPRQEVSCCMILNNADSLKKTLKSIECFVSEFVIGVDGNDDLMEEIGNVLVSYNIPKVMFQTESPLKIGFDEARNSTIEKATKDWILWIDDDETFHWPERIMKYLKGNQFDSYAIHQHHFSAEPPGLMKTDLPCRIFRNGKNIKFFGRVHEHPETGINKGAGKTYLIDQYEGAICHNGYDTEQTRRVRFSRNFPLMEQDRKDYPDRWLGKFLWIRDLSHMNRFELEQTGRPTEKIIARANEAIELWRHLLEKKQTRMVKDSLPYLYESVNIVSNQGGYEFRYSLDLSHRGMGDKSDKSPEFVTGKVLDKADLYELNKLLISEKIDPFDKNTKYLR